MAQPQQQYQMPPQRPYSPPQASPSPATTTHSFALPPNKRQRMSPQPSQPGSPYVQSPYGMSPGASTPQSAGASPHFANVQLPPHAYSTPYTAANGQTTPTLNLPQTNHNNNNLPYQSPLNFPTSNQNQNNHQPNTNYMMPPQGPGTMGPPSKPVEKPKEDGIDPMDVLGGTGIDLREEEQYTWQMNSKSFNSQQSGSQSGTISPGNSFTQFPPGDERSFYGAGPANVTPEVPNTKSQEEYHRKVVDKAWNDAAHDLAVSRQRELNHPFLTIGLVTQKMDKIARENGLVLKRDTTGAMGTMKLPSDFPSPSVNVQTAVGPNGAITATSGNFLPYESLLVDQVALISISTKHRLRGLLEDAARLAKGRQTSSHGAVPEEWKDVAVPARVTGGTDVTARNGWESAVSPHSNPLKRSLSTANRILTPVSDGTKTPTTNPSKFTNEVVTALRAQAVKERDFEEERLRKRRARQEGGTPSRAGSVIPGTPGSIAPDPMEKAPTKKEQKKKAEAKLNEAANHAAANVTTAQFLGGGGGIFGKKKKYSWMTGGGSGSGTSTPAKLMTQGLPGTPSGSVGNAREEKFTHEGVRRLGTWREDKEKGVGIQIRDWVTVLEEDGREKRALQRAYATLDESQPK